MEQHIYKCYTSDLLKVIAECVGVEVTTRFSELLNADAKEEKSADEIALEVIKRAGLKVKQNGCT